MNWLVELRWLEMNWLDLLFLLILAFNLLSGLYHGFLKQLMGVVGMVISFYFALRWGTDFINLLEPFIPLRVFLEDAVTVTGADFDWLASLFYNLIGFIILFILLQAAFRFVIAKLRLINLIPVVGVLNIAGGGLLGAFKGVLLAFIIASLISLLPTPFWELSRESSAIVALSERYMPIVVNYIREIIFRYLYT